MSATAPKTQLIAAHGWAGDSRAWQPWAELAAAREVIEVTTVQNLYNLGDRSAEDVLEVCEADGIGFIPWFPIAAGPLARADGPLSGIVARTGVPAAQLSLAWLLRRSSVMLPIPGTSSIGHLEENCAAADVVLDDVTFADLSVLGRPDDGAPA